MTSTGAVAPLVHLSVYSAKQNLNVEETYAYEGCATVAWVIWNANGRAVVCCPENVSEASDGRRA